MVGIKEETPNGICSEIFLRVTHSNKQIFIQDDITLEKNLLLTDATEY